MDDAHEQWRRTTLRRHAWLLGALVVLFAATEVAGVLRLVPHLEPVSLLGLVTNPLFAIGFGAPLVLQLSMWRGRPGRRELATVVLGVLLSLALLAVVPERTAMQWVIGFGLASTIVQASQWRDPEARLFLLPSLVALFFTLEAAMFLGVISHYAPLTYDGIAYAADARLGFNISFETGLLFERWPPVAAICTLIYLAPPPALIFVYALEARSAKKPAVDVVTMLVVMGAVGYALYFLVPVCGPKFAFPSFPHSAPPPKQFEWELLAVPPAPRNGVPSLHMASALVAWIHARRYGRVAGGVGMVFVIGTLLATMGTGEHYFVDLIAAVPFTLLFVWAASRLRAAPHASPRHRRELL